MDVEQLVQRVGAYVKLLVRVLHVGHVVGHGEITNTLTQTRIAALTDGRTHLKGQCSARAV